LFGGTFDPIHLGHTVVAAESAGRIRADKVIFIPAKRSPLKGFSPKASDEDRLIMISLAIPDAAQFEVSNYELRKSTPSYTLETVRFFQTQYGKDTLFYWLLGADSVEDLTYWYRVTELIDECNLAFMYRAGCKPPDFARFEAIWGSRRVLKLQQNVIETPLIDISSTEVRRRLAVGENVSDMLHSAVADYIHKHGLYR
jgi:nicotinate-nucleotide adenylyltransferase